MVGEPDVSDSEWSIEGSPPIADDARRGRPAQHDQQRQGGCPTAKSQVPEGKPRSIGDAKASATVYLPEVVCAACAKFEYFFGLSPGKSRPVMINARSSLTVAGLVDAHFLDWDVIDSER